MTRRSLGRPQQTHNSHNSQSIMQRALRMIVALPIVAFTVAFMALLAVGWRAPVASAQGAQTTTPTHALHALPIREDPAANAILQSPPPHVRIVFDEAINPLTSRIVVIDTVDHEVDLQDSQVNSADPRIMTVSLPLLRAGTYVVVWRAQSSDDGHVTEGSYIFRVARPDGSVPPIPATLPTSHILGGGQALTNGSLDGPTLLQTFMTWLALVGMTFWVGGLIWETWVLPASGQRDPDLAAAAEAAARRFARLAPYALGLVLLADVGIVLAESAELVGDWSGLLSPIYLRAIVFGSQFGFFWWMRQLVALVALALMLLVARRRVATPVPAHRQASPLDAASDIGAIPDWRREVALAFRGIGALPRRLVAGVRLRSGEERLLLLLGAALIVAFVLSGHAAAVPGAEFWYAFGVDLFHVTATTAWLGGLLYITFVLLPASRALGERRRARLLALGLPGFGALALLAALLLATTGSLNTAVHLTSITQFLTTTYGRTLAVKIEFFLVMAAISAYHAFFLRPRLAQTLPGATEKSGRSLRRQRDAWTDLATHGAQGTDWARSIAATLHDEDETVATPASAAPAQRATPTIGAARAAATMPAPQRNASPAAQPAITGAPLSTRAQRLVASIEGWILREALLGIGVLFCVALLGAFAGSLTAPPPAASGHSTGPFQQTKTAGAYSVALKVAPAVFGANTFTVTLTDAQGKPIPGATIQGQTADLDMDMGVQSFQLKAVGASQPGVYMGQSDLTMGGNWQISIKVTPPGGQRAFTVTYRLAVTYQ